MLVPGLELEADVLGAVTPGGVIVTVTVIVLTGIPALELKIDVTVWDRAGGISVTVLTGVPALLESKFDVTV